MGNPRRQDNIEYRQDGADVIVQSASGEELRLSGAAAAVFLAADGSRNIVALHDIVCTDVAPDATRETVFAALDALADLGLLAERAAPPASSFHGNRRDMMKWVGAAAAVTVMAPVARGDDAKEREAEEKEKQEQKEKEAEEKEKRATEEKKKLEEKEKEETEKEKKEEEELQKRKAAEEKQKRAMEEEQKKAEEASKREAEEAEKASFPGEGEEEAKAGQAKAQEAQKKAQLRQEEASKRSDSAQQQGEQHQKKAQEHQQKARSSEQKRKDIR